MLEIQLCGNNYTYVDKIADLVKLTEKQLELSLWRKKTVKIENLKHQNFRLDQILRLN